MTQKLNIFISYSHKDENFKDALDTHLAMLKRSNKVATWNDRAILAGTEWDAKIKQQLQEAHIIVLLTSASFLASNYIWEEEIKHAMERHEAKTARIIPIIIKACLWQNAPFAKIQALPRDAKPIGHVANDEVWMQVAQGISAVVDDLLAKGVGVYDVIQEKTTPIPQNQQALHALQAQLRNHINQADAAGFFETIDAALKQGSITLPNLALLNRLRQEFIHGNTGFDYYDRLKALLSTLLH